MTPLFLDQAILLNWSQASSHLKLTSPFSFQLSSHQLDLQVQAGARVGGLPGSLAPFSMPE